VLGSSLGTTLEIWEAQRAPLLRTHRLLRYDRRGHGRSPAQPGRTTIETLARDVLELLDQLGLRRASFCGLSLGGAEAMWIAAHEPHRVDRLVLCCTAPSFPPRDAWIERAAAVRSGGMESIADAVLARWFRPELRTTRPDVVARCRAMLVSTPVEGYAACCEALGDMDLWPAVGRIVAPTLVLTGSDDPVVPPAAGDELAATMRGAMNVVIESAAHIANIEQPAAFDEALAAHLGEGG
jgi:3-oxoadipate enol-lactonase